MSNFNFPLDRSMPKAHVEWFGAVGRLCNALTGSGTTAQRPVRGLYVGRTYFDTTLGGPIWFNGSGWVDAGGNSV